MNREPAKLEKRIPALDTLRGLAILAVLSRHLVWDEPRPVGGLGGLLFGLTDSAWCGVDLFFVLSGFLITGILFDSKGSQTYFSTFYKRRVIRIIPLYYGVLLLCLVILPIFVHGDPDLHKMVGQEAWLWLFGTNLLIGWQQQWAFISSTVSLGHFWTLAVEEQFYLIWPLVVLLLDRRRLMWVCVAAIAGALGARLWLFGSGANHVPLFVFTWCRMDALAIGAFLALAIRGARGLPALTKPAWAGLITSGAILGWLMIRQGGRLNYHYGLTMTFGFTVIACFFGSLLIVGAAAREGTLGGRFWSSRILKFFSKYSYGLFVFQAIPKSFYHALFPLETLTGFFGSHLVAFAVYCVLVLGSMVLMAMLSWHLYEKHFMKLRRHLPYVYTKGPAPQSSSPKPLERLMEA